LNTLHTLNARKVPQNMKSVIPATAMYNQIRAQNTLRESDKERYEKEIKNAQKTVREVSLAVFRYRNIAKSLDERAQNAFNAIENVLMNSGVEIIDYTGSEMTDELMKRVTIESWESGTAPVELVLESFSPEIRWNGELLHSAQLFCSRADPEAKAKIETPETPAQEPEIAAEIAEAPESVETAEVIETTEMIEITEPAETTETTETTEIIEIIEIVEKTEEIAEDTINEPVQSPEQTQGGFKKFWRNLMNFFGFNKNNEPK